MNDIFKPVGETALDGNNLLASLRPEHRQVLVPAMRVAHVKTAQILQEPGGSVRHCYFPRYDAIASYFVLLESGRAVETLMIGREGAMGGIVSHGSLPAFARGCVMRGGSFYRIPLPELEEAKAAVPAIGLLFTRYADCLLAQTFQSVACNASHTIEQRAAKWLCSAVDRTGSQHVAMTQEQLAALMGVGRSYASRVVQKLKGAGLVKTRRGGIEVLDYAGTLARACRCDHTVRHHFDTVLRGVYPPPPPDARN